MVTWWVNRSSSAPVRRSEPKVSVHSSKGRLLVIKVEPRSLRWEISSKSNSAPVLESGTMPAPHAGLRLARPAHDCDCAEAVGAEQHDLGPPDVLLGRVAFADQR